MADQYVSKVVYAGETLMDLTSDTIAPDKLLKGYTAHGPDGAPITGTCPYNNDTSDATAKASEILQGKTAYVASGKIEGTMPNKGAVAGSISKKDEPYTIPMGYHDGSGTVGISSTEKAKLIPTNIRQGVTVLGVVGTMSGTEAAKAQAKVVTPSTQQQVIVPDSSEGYNYLSQVTVEAIPYSESSNNAGGLTVTIG